MYDDYVQFTDDGSGLVLTKQTDPAIYNDGRYDQLLIRHVKHVARAFVLARAAGLTVLNPVLMRRIADARTMYAAAVHLRRNGGRAPGPNGLRLEELDTSEIWGICRAMAASARNGIYQPGRARSIRIPKLGKPGRFRTLRIQNVEDRIVGRAVVEVLQPITEMLADPFSFGFRPGRSRLNALATAVALICSQGRSCVAKCDMKDAFDRVPLGRLEQTLSMQFPLDIINFVMPLVRQNKNRGVAQGSPLSPLLFNHYADHAVGRAWNLRHPNDPLIRYADDLLLAFRSAEEALAGRLTLERLARSAGLPLKPAKESPVCDLTTGESVTWLGYRLRAASRHLDILISDHAWQQLDFRLAQSHFVSAPPLRAVDAVRGWLGQMGPCYPSVDAKKMIRRVAAMATAQGFDELPSQRSMLALWQLAYGRWLRVYDRESLLLQGRSIESEIAARRRASASA